MKIILCNASNAARAARLWPAALVGISVSLHGWAAPAATPAGAGSDNSGLEEIVVTAEKRNSTVQ